MSEAERPTSSRFRWIPGEGPDREALARIAARFGRPPNAMGQAWFMGEDRTIYDWLLGDDLADRPVEDIQHVLAEIASGLPIFGHVDSWADWYVYLLPRCIPRAFEHYVDYLVEFLVTAFMVVMPDSSGPWRYPSFREDALLTLGRAIMAPENWPEGAHASVGCLHPVATVPTGYPIWADASGDFSASMFFCLKYLTADDVPAWTKSVFAIPCPRWRAQLMVWLCGAHDLIDGTIAQPAKLKEGHFPGVDWTWYHGITGTNHAYDEEVGQASGPIEFLPEANRKAFARAVTTILSEELISEWLESLMAFEYLFDDLTGTAIPERLREQYGL